MTETVTPAAFAPPDPAFSRAASSGLLWFLGLALLGGLILNVMPCVLPVLLLKLTLVIESRGRPRAELRRSFLATAAGILAAFLALAAALIALKQAGAAVGWGMQFQQPWFLAALAALCLVFAANVWGWFEVGIPAFAGALGRAGERAAARRPGLGAFLGGVLAAVLATPCSAPFLGTALGFALARGPVEIAAAFALMGLGLAAPYLAIAAWPRAVALLPRPGRWMVWLKRALGLSLAATALWLLLILAGTQGWRWPPGGPAAETAESKGIPWRRFDPALIAAEVAAGRTVFVEVTADWCLTCRLNEELVIASSPVRERLAAPDVAAFRADWTRPDPAIAAYLAAFGRYGIPFAVVYGPRAKAGLPLPELLSREAVLAALAAAGG